MCAAVFQHVQEKYTSFTTCSGAMSQHMGTALFGLHWLNKQHTRGLISTWKTSHKQNNKDLSHL